MVNEVGAVKEQASRDAAAVPLVVPNTLGQAADPEADLEPIMFGENAFRPLIGCSLNAGHRERL